MGNFRAAALADEWDESLFDAVAGSALPDRAQRAKLDNTKRCKTAAATTRIRLQTPRSSRAVGSAERKNLGNL
jgi:hypothetical protein